MRGLILDINNIDAFVTFDDGTTSYIGISHLPKGVKIGDSVDTERDPQVIINDKLTSSI